MSAAFSEILQAAERAADGSEADKRALAQLLNGIDLAGLGRPEDRARLAVLLDRLGMREQAMLALHPGDGEPGDHGAGMANLAGILASGHGNYEQARELFAQALSAAGDGTHMQVKALANLATLSLLAGEAGTASAWLALARSIHGQADDPATDVLLVSTEFGIARAQGDLPAMRASISQLNEATRERIAELGPDHPFALTAVASLAAADFEVAAAEESADGQERAIAVLEVAAHRLAADLGADHPQALTCLENMCVADFSLARAIRSPDRASRAASMLEAVSRRTTAALGENHPQARAAAANAASARVDLQGTRTSAVAVPAGLAGRTLAGGTARTAPQSEGPALVTAPPPGLTSFTRRAAEPQRQRRAEDTTLAAADLSSQLRSSFSRKALAALSRAANTSLPDRPVGTLDICLALMEVDPAADWQRISLFRIPATSDADRYQDPLPHADDWWDGHPVTVTCARAIRAAVALAGGSGLLPVPAGVLALCLVGTPATAASRALGATSEPTHSLLLELMQDALIGARWDDITSVLRACGAAPDPPAPGALEADDPEVRRFLDATADRFHALIDALNQFLRAESPQRAGALLEQHPELLTAPFDTIITNAIREAAQAGNGADAWRLRERRRFLENYRQLIDKPSQETPGHQSWMPALEVRLRKLQNGPDPGPVLDAATLEEAAELLASADDLRSDARLLMMAGGLHFMQWAAFQDEGIDRQEELMVAMALFAAVLDGHTDLLDKRLRKFLNRERRQKPQSGDHPASTALRTFLNARRPAGQAWAELLWQVSLLQYDSYQKTGQVPVLSEAIALLRHAVKATPPDDPGYRSRAASLGSWLLVLHEESRRPADLDEALEILHHPFLGMPDDADWQPELLSAQGSALHSLFSLDSDLDALDDAIRFHRDALWALPADDPRYGHLALPLAGALLQHYERTARVASLDYAIGTLQAAQTAAARHGERSPGVIASLANNLSVAFTARHERTKHETDLDRAIAAGRQAVSAADDGTGLASAHGTLGMALLARYVRYAAGFRPPAFTEESLGHLLEEALGHLRMAVTLTPVDRPERAARLANLGTGLLHAWESGAPPAILGEADAALSAAADSGSGTAPVRARASLTVGRLAANRGDWHAAADRMEAAIYLLDAAVPRGLRREDREYQLSQLRDLGCDAAACAWRDGDTERAVRLFEHGRGVLLTQEMGTPTELDRLHAESEKLARDFTALQLAIESAERHDLVSDPGDWTKRTAAEKRRILRSKWDDLLAQIRAKDGFRNFPQPQHEDLLHAGREGPVVLLNVSKYGSAAFVIRDGNVAAVGLPALTPATVRAMVSELLTVTGKETVSPLDTQQRLDHLLGWLWDAVAGPVLGHMGMTTRLDPDAGADGPPRVWWCPSGLLSFLPLHAAGHHATRSDASPQTVMDRVISSYTPTLRMLEHARQPPARSAEGTLIVAPARGIHRMSAEWAVADGKATVAVLADADATPKAVLSALPRYSRVYFVGHATSDMNNPSMGYMELHGGERLSVADVTALRLDNAEFAFLVAGSTYQGGTALPDEAIHIGGAFRLAGYRHVIAALWPIKDSPSTYRIVQAVHEGVTGPGVIATAACLHRATRNQRDLTPDLPSLWAPYVHSGS